MNIFVLDNDPRVAAEMMLDKHVVKMPTETMQMICTNLDHLGYKDELPMKPVMLNHPCTIWMRQSYGNFLWCINHLNYLCKEYTLRYGKIHKVETYLKSMIDNVYDFLETEFGDWSKMTQTPFIMAMPDKYRNDNVVKAYRDYYLGDKWQFATWKTNKPNWWPSNHEETKKQEMINKLKKMKPMRSD